MLVNKKSLGKSTNCAITKRDKNGFLADCVCDSGTQHDIPWILLQIDIHRCPFLIAFKENREVLIHRGVLGHVLQ